MKSVVMLNVCPNMAIAVDLDIISLQVQSDLVNANTSRLEILFQIASCLNYRLVDINMYYLQK